MSIDKERLEARRWLYQGQDDLEAARVLLDVSQRLLSPPD
jgi:hypothetical protein